MPRRERHKHEHDFSPDYRGVSICACGMSEKEVAAQAPKEPKAKPKRKAPKPPETQTVNTSPPVTVDPSPGETARDEAVERAKAHADPQFLERAYECVVHVARRQKEFTSDVPVAVLEETAPELKPHEPRAWGAVMVKARREKVIAPTDRYQPTTRKQGHRGPRRIWKSLLYTESL